MTNISDDDVIYTIADMRKERDGTIDKALEVVLWNNSCIQFEELKEGEHE